MELDPWFTFGLELLSAILIKCLFVKRRITDQRKLQWGLTYIAAHIDN